MDEFQIINQELCPWGKGKKSILRFRDQNIYSDVSPFVETAVVIGYNKNQESRDDALKNQTASQYINACFVKSAYSENDLQSDPKGTDPFSLIICTPGPMKNTKENFWKMVKEQNVKRILTLCHKISDNPGSEAVQYFPKLKEDIVNLNNQWQITV